MYDSTLRHRHTRVARNSERARPKLVTPANVHAHRRFSKFPPGTPASVIYIEATVT